MIPTPTLPSSLVGCRRRKSTPAGQPTLFWSPWAKHNGHGLAGNSGATFSAGVSDYANQGPNAGNYWLTDATLAGVNCSHTCARGTDT